MTLSLGDLGRAVAFYRDGLGWPLSGASEENVAFFKTGGVVLALYAREALAEDVGLDPEGGGLRASRWRTMWIGGNGSTRRSRRRLPRVRGS